MAQEEKKKKNRLSYMILSVIIAVIAWSVVTYTTDPDITKTLSGIRVEFLGEDALAENGFVVINRNDIPKVSVKMSGKRSDLIKAIDRTRILVDVSAIDEEGDVELECTVKLPVSRISVEKVSMQTVPVTIAPLETKDVPVRVVQTGEIPGKLVKSVPETETVTIKGAKSELDLLESAEVTVDISTVTDHTTMALGYSLVLTEGVDREMLTTLIITENVLNINNTLYEARQMPVKLIIKGDGEYRLNEEESVIDPQTVTVGVTDATSAPEYITVTIDENAEEGEYRVEKHSEVYIPEQNKKIKIKPVWEK